MRKEILAAFCVLTIMASTAPIFAADTAATTPAVLTDAQLTKLDALQATLTNLVNKIEGLKTKYKSTKKTKGLLIALNQYEKQIKRLNTTITNYRKNPTANADKKIKSFQYRTKVLTWKVNVKEKILKKVTKKKSIHTKKPITTIKDPIKCTG